MVAHTLHVYKTFIFCSMCTKQWKPGQVVGLCNPSIAANGRAEQWLTTIEQMRAGCSTSR